MLALWSPFVSLIPLVPFWKTPHRFWVTNFLMPWRLLPCKFATLLAMCLPHALYMWPLKSLPFLNYFISDLKRLNAIKHLNKMLEHIYIYMRLYFYIESIGSTHIYCDFSRNFWVVGCWHVYGYSIFVLPVQYSASLSQSILGLRYIVFGFSVFLFLFFSLCFQQTYCAVYIFSFIFLWSVVSMYSMLGLDGYANDDIEGEKERGKLKERKK